MPKYEQLFREIKSAAEKDQLTKLNSTLEELAKLGPNEQWYFFVTLDKVNHQDECALHWLLLQEHLQRVVIEKLWEMEYGDYPNKEARETFTETKPRLLDNWIKSLSDASKKNILTALSHNSDVQVGNTFALLINNDTVIELFSCQEDIRKMIPDDRWQRLGLEQKNLRNFTQTLRQFCQTHPAPEAKDNSFFSIFLNLKKKFESAGLHTDSSKLFSSDLLRLIDNHLNLLQKQQQSQPSWIFKPKSSYIEQLEKMRDELIKLMHVLKYEPDAAPEVQYVV